MSKNEIRIRSLSAKHYEMLSVLAAEKKISVNKLAVQILEEYLLGSSDKTILVTVLDYIQQNTEALNLLNSSFELLHERNSYDD